MHELSFAQSNTIIPQGSSYRQIGTGKYSESGDSECNIEDEDEVAPLAKLSGVLPNFDHRKTNSFLNLSPAVDQKQLKFDLMQLQ
jgi:hypothetical protein